MFLGVGNMSFYIFVKGPIPTGPPEGRGEGPGPRGGPMGGPIKAQGPRRAQSPQGPTRAQGFAGLDPGRAPPAPR